MRCSYANDIDYKNAIWSWVAEGVDGKIMEVVQAIPEACVAYPNATLVDFYDSPTMSSELVKAHAHLNVFAGNAYGIRPAATASDCVALLLKLYAEKTKGSAAQ